MIFYFLPLYPPSCDPIFFLFAPPFFPHSALSRPPPTPLVTGSPHGVYACLALTSPLFLFRASPPLSSPESLCSSSQHCLYRLPSLPCLRGRIPVAVCCGRLNSLGRPQLHARHPTLFCSAPPFFPNNPQHLSLLGPPTASTLVSRTLLLCSYLPLHHYALLFRLAHIFCLLPPLCDFSPGGETRVSPRILALRSSNKPRKKRILKTRTRTNQNLNASNLNP